MRHRTSVHSGALPPEVINSVSYLRGSRSRLSTCFGGGIGSNTPHPPPQGQQGQIQLLSIPQIDAIQRTLRIMDVRLQHVQNNIKDEERSRVGLDHMRKLMSENQNALTSVVAILTSIQEEVRKVSVVTYKQLQQPMSIQLIQVPNKSRLNSKGSKDSGSKGSKDSGSRSPSAVAV